MCVKISSFSRLHYKIWTRPDFSASAAVVCEAPPASTRLDWLDVIDRSCDQIIKQTDSVCPERQRAGGNTELSRVFISRVVNWRRERQRGRLTLKLQNQLFQTFFFLHCSSHVFNINHLNISFQSVKLLLMRPDRHCRVLEVNDDQNQIHRQVDEHKQLRIRTTSHQLHEDKNKIKSTAEQK